jgi:hypothetical protein
VQPLEKLVRLWQRRLRLSDWIVGIRWASNEQIAAWGSTIMDESELIATVCILDSLSREQAEATVIHELLHLRLLPFSDGDESEPKHVEREQAINVMASCYLKAYGPWKGWKPNDTKA